MRDECVPIARPASRPKAKRGPLYRPVRRHVPGPPLPHPRPRPSGREFARVVPTSDAHALLLTLARRGRGRLVADAVLVTRALGEHPTRFRRAGRADAGVVRATLARLVARGLVARVAGGSRLTAEGWRGAAEGDLRAAARRRAVRVVRAAIDARVACAC